MPEEELLTVDEAAKRLSLSPNTIRKWILNREIKYMKIGSKAVRIPASVVEAKLKVILPKNNNQGN